MAVACGAATVCPGDIVVGDDDGALVVPPELADELADAAAEQELKEEFITERVRAGAGIEGLYPLNERWEQVFRQWIQDHRKRGGGDRG